ncbi:MAG TPA: peroxiredoxin [Thermoplasmataceae archaeon]|nr:peroxiredoxin [Thermoplasmataceae archaeon]
MVDLLSIGTKAPDFHSVDQEGKEISLSHFKGRPVILYFYPKDDTPGCTKEACNFRDNYSQYEARGVKVLGVSVDDQESHRKFAEKYNLNFTLVADDSKDISRKYGALGDNVAKRVTYIIDKEGSIAHVYPNVNPDQHSDEVMAKLQDLGLVS